MTPVYSSATNGSSSNKPLADWNTSCSISTFELYMCRTMAEMQKRSCCVLSHIRGTDRRWMGGVIQESTSDRGFLFYLASCKEGAGRWQKPCNQSVPNVSPVKPLQDNWCPRMTHQPVVKFPIWQPQEADGKETHHFIINTQMHTEACWRSSSVSKTLILSQKTPLSMGS